MRIVFMGTPDYCVPTISKLIKEGHKIEAVFCQPDKPVGRKQVLTPPPAKVFAGYNGIPVFQPKTLRDGEAHEMLKGINPDIIVVVAYGKILPKEILYLPKYGSVNGHASLLPKLRGASPIQWAIVTGEKKTGVTVMQMDEGMDTGDILKTKEIDILEEDNAETLFSKLSFLTADLMADTLKDIENGDIHPTKQDDGDATYAPIINKEMAHIDFSKDSGEIVNLIRGFYPWPAAFCFINGKRIKVFSAKVSGKTASEPGLVIENNSKLIISAGNNTAIEFSTVQPEGGRVMSAQDMLRGNKISIGTAVG